MSVTVGNFLIARLHALGVRVIFGYPGDGINGVFGALAMHRADSGRGAGRLAALLGND